MANFFASGFISEALARHRPKNICEFNIKSDKIMVLKRRNGIRRVCGVAAEEDVGEEEVEEEEEEEEEGNDGGEIRVTEADSPKLKRVPGFSLGKRGIS